MAICVRRYAEVLLFGRGSETACGDTVTVQFAKLYLELCATKHDLLDLIRKYACCAKSALCFSTDNYAAVQRASCKLAGLVCVVGDFASVLCAVCGNILRFIFTQIWH